MSNAVVDQMAHYADHLWRMDAFELRDALRFTLIALCHLCLDPAIAAALCEYRALEKLLHLYKTIQAHAPEFQLSCLEILRNLSVVPFHGGAFPVDATSLLWQVALSQGHPSPSRIAAMDTLCNVAFHSPCHASVNDERLAQLFDQFQFEPDRLLRVAIADLLCNLACDASCCLYMIVALEEKKPKGFRHSGVVHLLMIAETEADQGLRMSMEALSHNLAWGDASGKRHIQKLGLSSFMEAFAKELALLN